MPSFMKGKFYGMVTVGERGQVVIPAELRTKLAIEPGDKLVACGALGDKGFIMIKAESVTEHIDKIIEHLSEARKAVKTSKSTSETSGRLRKST